MVRVTYCFIAATCFVVAGCADPVQIAPPEEGVSSAASHTVSFTGYIFDGVTGDRVTDYTIQHQVTAEPTSGTVDGEGRYALGAFSVWDDFTIIIDASGYRPFLSHNRNTGLPSGVAGSDDVADIDSHQTLHYDAYLFPSDQEAPAVTFTIKSPLPEEQPEGTMRIRPVTASVLADQSTEIPVGVNGQQWFNDEDLQGNTLTKSFTGGELSLESGQLVYGVRYAIDIYDVTGYQPFTGNYTAGVETDKTFTLTEELAQPLELLSSTAIGCTPPPPTDPNDPQSAVVVLTFNHAIEFDDTVYPGGAVEALDDFLSISSPNQIPLEDANVLNDDSGPSVLDRGVSADINDKTLTLEWSALEGLATKDSADPILTVSYNSLNVVQLRRAGSSSSTTALSTLVGSSSITCSH